MIHIKDKSKTAENFIKIGYTSVVATDCTNRQKSDDVMSRRLPVSESTKIFYNYLKTMLSDLISLEGFEETDDFTAYVLEAFEDDIEAESLIIIGQSYAKFEHIFALSPLFGEDSEALLNEALEEIRSEIYNIPDELADEKDKLIDIIAKSQNLEEFLINIMEFVV